jgi:hypothetical protein
VDLEGGNTVVHFLGKKGMDREYFLILWTWKAVVLSYISSKKKEWTGNIFEYCGLGRR